jgi:hypothetical protein
MVDEYYHGKRPTGIVIHHYDINPKNNTNKNLERMTRSEHNRRHALLNELGNKPENVKRRVATLKRNVRINAGFDPNFPLAPWQYAYALKIMTEEQKKEFWKNKNSSYEMRESSTRRARHMNHTYWKSDAGKARRQELSKTQLKAALKIKMDKEDESWLASFDNTRVYGGVQEIRNIYGGSTTAIRRRLKKIGIVIKHKRSRLSDERDAEWLSRFDSARHYSTLNDIIRIYGGTFLQVKRRLSKINFINYGDSHFNHKIVKIECIKTNTPVPVYDIEVPLTDNFALGAGIFVHNSKDLADAVASIVYHMHVDPLYGNEDLIISSVHGSPDEKGESRHNTGDSEKDQFLDWITGGLIQK